MRGRGKASRATLIWGRSPAREDGGVGPFTGETFLNRASSFNPPPLFPFALLELGSCRPCKRHCPPGGAGKEGREPGGRDTRLGSLHPLLPRHRGSPIWRGTGFSRAALRGSPRRLAGRGRDVPFPPLMHREMREYPKNTHLKGAGEQRRFLNALTFRV